MSRRRARSRRDCGGPIEPGAYPPGGWNGLGDIVASAHDGSPELATSHATSRHVSQHRDERPGALVRGSNMARALSRPATRPVAAHTSLARRADGGGLYLRITPAANLSQHAATPRLPTPCRPGSRCASTKVNRDHPIYRADLTIRPKAWRSPRPIPAHIFIPRLQMPRRSSTMSPGTMRSGVPASSAVRSRRPGW